MTHEGLLVRFMNLPRWRNSSQSSVTLEEKTAAPSQPDDKNFQGSALYFSLSKNIL
jgi:hypothetical protein